MVLASVIVALLFVHYQTTEFRKATVVTTVDTTTAPLSEVYFPSVTICNINQVTSKICGHLFFAIQIELLLNIYLKKGLTYCKLKNKLHLD